MAVVSEVPDVELIYVGDPMCSWCWGFAPALRALEAGFELPLRVMVGGLRPGPSAQPLDAAMRDFLAHHWTQVADATGQPFDHRVLDTDGFVYDTETADMAVVVARRQQPERTLDVFELIQRGFYTGTLDPTNPVAISEAVAGIGFDTETMLAGLGDEAVRSETWRDFAQAHQWGITGFPTLLLRDRDSVGIVARGWMPAEPLIEGLTRWLVDNHGDAGRALAGRD